MILASQDDQTRLCLSVSAFSSLHPESTAPHSRLSLRSHSRLLPFPLGVIYRQQT